MTRSAGWRQNRFIHRYSHVRRSIGFTDSSNPFYLFSKLNAGLLLWAPFAPTMREEYPLLIALEADGWTLMPRTATAGPRVDSSSMKAQSSRIASLTIDDLLTDIRFRDSNSSKNMVALPWEDDE
ncbi:MAG: hypothetical protein OJF50_003513 [Nitrospira sp.]|jgi:hypothetical protein|nr:hypothetical protein [Nitrospira sp.]